MDRRGERWQGIGQWARNQEDMRGSKGRLKKGGETKQRCVSFETQS